MPEFPEAHFNYALQLSEIKDYKTSKEHFHKAIDLEQDFAEAHYNRGNALNELGNLNEAIESYQKAISINPNNL